MKIVLVIASLGAGGAERVASLLASEFAIAGHDVSLISYADVGPDQYLLEKHVRRIRLRGSESNLGPLKKVGRNFWLVLQLRRKMKTLKPDIAIGFMPESNVLVALMPATHVRIGTEHAYFTFVKLSKPWRFLRRILYRRLDTIVCITRDNQQALLSQLRLTSATVIPNPIEFPLSSGQGRPFEDAVASLPPGAKLLLAVGRLVEQKDFSTLLRIFTPLADRFQDWHLLICGEGYLRQSLETEARDLAISDRVHFAGLVTDMGQAYESASILAVTSIFEGFGNMIAEAHCHGKPVVSFDCLTGPGEQIKHGVNGFLVEPGDLGSFRRHLALLMQDTHLRDRMGKNSQSARSDYDPKIIAERYLLLFDNLMKSGQVYVETTHS